MVGVIPRQAAIVATCIFMLYVSRGQATQFTASPQQITIGGVTPTPQLRIECRLDSFGITSVFALEIGKKTFGGHSPIVSIVINGNVKVDDQLLLPRLTPSGSITETSGNVQMILRNLTCMDAANTYYCQTSYRTSTIQNDEETLNVTVTRVYPENMRLEIMPNSQIYANPPVPVTFECSGYIGNQFDQNMANFWVWEWRFSDDGFAQWTRYPDSTDIDYQDPPTPVTAVCQYSGRSTLRYTVQATDNRREFRCYVVSPEYGGNKTIYTQDPSIPGQIGGGDSIMTASNKGLLTVIMTFVTWAMLLMS